MISQVQDNFLPQTLSDAYHPHLSFNASVTITSIRSISLFTNDKQYGATIVSLRLQILRNRSLENSWTDRISPAKIEPLRHVRCLAYVLDTTVWFNPLEYCIYSPSNYFPLFTTFVRQVERPTVQEPRPFAPRSALRSISGIDKLTA